MLLTSSVQHITLVIAHHLVYSTKVDVRFALLRLKGHPNNTQ